jgi:hypothetical protein
LKVIEVEETKKEESPKKNSSPNPTKEAIVS